MPTLFSGNLHAGLSGLELQEPSFDLGCGLTLSKTYAHLMAPFMMAFKPAPKGSHHHAPWKAAQGGSSVDINAELCVPEAIEGKFGSKIEVARTVLFLLRLGVNPATTLPVFSNHAFAALRDVEDNETDCFRMKFNPAIFLLALWVAELRLKQSVGSPNDGKSLTN